MKITWASVYRCESSLEMFSRIWKNWKIRLEEDYKDGRNSLIYVPSDKNTRGKAIGQKTPVMLSRKVCMRRHCLNLCQYLWKVFSKKGMKKVLLSNNCMMQCILGFTFCKLL